MRNLIIRRNAANAGKNAPFYIFITDPAGKHTVNGVSCTLLGAANNGETVYFPIGDQETTIYVLPNASAQNISCEYCTLSAGNQDVYLIGGCKRAGKGQFRFHFQDNDAAPQRDIFKLLISICLTLTLIAAGILFIRNIPQFQQQPVQGKAKVFAAEGMQITLTDAFSEVDVRSQGFTLGYASKDTVIYILKYPFTGSDGMENIATKDFANIVIGQRPELVGSAYQEEGLTLFEYTETDSNGETVSYLAVFIKGHDGFWCFEFSTLEANASALRGTYIQYAKSICFPASAI